MQRFWIKTVSVTVAGFFLVVSPVFSAIAEDAHGSKTELNADYFAIIDGETISKREFDMAFQAGMRKRFYHGKVPEEQLKAFREDVKNTLVDRVLMLQEAKRRGIKPDSAIVKDQLAKYEARYAARPDWKKYREDILAGLRVALEEEDILRLLQQHVKQIPSPEAKDVEQFYKKNPQFFTTPKRARVSLILLKVAPSSGADVWDAAREEATQLLGRLRKGADFTEMARIHSGDPSATKGGDMGFLHEGMLSSQAELVIEGLQVGEVSEPLMMLQGVAIFRLDEREQDKLNAFADVAERAGQLLKRELEIKAWRDLLVQLRERASIKINTAGL